jgi:phytoene desaturase
MFVKQKMNPLKYNKKAVVIGSGFAGLSVAASLAQKGIDVSVLEKNDSLGGRARIFRHDGYLFDMGPSWYWMPDVFEKFYNQFGRTASDFYQLKRLDPSYQVIFSKDESIALSANLEELKKQFENIEKGSGASLEKFLHQAKIKYEAGMTDFVNRPSVHFSEFIDLKILKSLFQLDLFQSFSAHTRKFFKDPRLISLIEFPVLFLGAMPQQIPALYSLMNYADISLGTWYPMGGMHKVVEAMKKIAEEQGVEFKTNTQVEGVETFEKTVKNVLTNNGSFKADIVVAAADYHHVEQKILDKQHRNYSDSYWVNRTMAPSSLIYYVGVNKKVSKLLHHNLFFDEDMGVHSDEIYKNPQWPSKPLFYVCCPSKTDPEVSPEGKENLFLLIPVAAGIKDDESIREKYFDMIIKRMESFCGEEIASHIEFKRSYAYSDFVKDYNAYKGNAYGLANTLTQTAFLKPSIQNKKLKNLFYTGQLTVPGPGVPPSIISGQVVADYIVKNFNQ